MSTGDGSEQRPVVHLVDDDAAVRASVASMIDGQRYSLCSHDSARGFLEQYSSAQCGCMLLDISMPEMSGLELQEEILRRGWTIPIVFITGNARVADSVQALKAGAIDFLEKPFNRETLELAIRNALEIDRQDRAEVAQQAANQERFSRLTVREWEVLTLMVSGSADLSSKQIARDLDISHRTVEHHRARVLEKTGSQSVAELAKLASIAGIIDRDDTAE